MLYVTLEPGSEAPLAPLLRAAGTNRLAVSLVCPARQARAMIVRARRIAPRVQAWVAAQSSKLVVLEPVARCDLRIVPCLEGQSLTAGAACPSVCSGRDAVAYASAPPPAPGPP